MTDEAAATGVQPFVDTIPVGDAVEPTEAQGERSGRRRNRRGRGGRDRDEATGSVEGTETAAAEAVVEAGTEVPNESVDGVPGEAPVAAEGEDREGRRRGRGRDRQRRERRDEGAAPVETAASGDAAPMQTALDLPATLHDASSSALAQVELAAVPVAQVAAPVAAPAPAAVVVAPFVLPSDDLNALAESAGLQWVNSDADKIRAVQEAMANEPKPIHVPRERKPVVVVDEGPLVLVETRKDLSQIKLPFDSQTPTH